MATLSGWGGRVVTGGRALPVTRWQVTDSAEPVNVTTGSSGSINEYLGGYGDVAVQVDCLWDQALNVFSAPVDLSPGGFVSLTLYLDFNSALRRYLLPAVLVTEVATDADVRGPVKYTLTGKQSGSSGVIRPTN